MLNLIAEHLSANLHVSLMSQYFPPYKSAEAERKIPVSHQKYLSRTITSLEYKQVLESFHALGFTRGWSQDYTSHLIYRPDFSAEDPFTGSKIPEI